MKSFFAKLVRRTRDKGAGTGARVPRRELRSHVLLGGMLLCFGMGLVLGSLPWSPLGSGWAYFVPNDLLTWLSPVLAPVGLIILVAIIVLCYPTLSCVCCREALPSVALFRGK